MAEDEETSQPEIWKLSHGTNTFSTDQLKEMLDSRLAVMGIETLKGQGDRFVNAKVGTVFFLCHSNSIQLLGQFTSGLEPAERGKEYRQRHYRVLAHAKKHDRVRSSRQGWSPAYNSTFFKVPDNELQDFESVVLSPYFDLKLSDISALIAQHEHEVKMPVVSHPPLPSNGPLNRILFGPPGTGKTYRSVAEAVAIVDNKSSLLLMEEKEYKATKARFDALRKEGRIEFVTFHSSYAYQDFVEGIRPKPTDAQNLTYVVEPGILKRIAEKAEENWRAFNASQQERSERTRFQQVFDLLRKKIEDSETGSLPAQLITEEFTVQLQLGLKPDSLAFKTRSGATTHPLSTKNLENLWVRRDEVKKPADVRLTNSSYYLAALKQLEAIDAELGGTAPTSSQSVELKRFVLVVDEINRGNISKIFGELITLIEEDKRLGGVNALTVRLPYSDAEDPPFGLPPNLYIVGTMNTADRSIALMDTALRRRFAFTELMPDPKVLRQGLTDGIDLPLLLERINDRIAFLFDREHTIGHAYFTNAATFDDIAHVLRNRVIPLLQEYFHDDWSKIRMVFNDMEKKANLCMVVEKKKPIDKLFSGSTAGLKDRTPYELQTNLTFEVVQAIYQ